MKNTESDKMRQKRTAPQIAKFELRAAKRSMPVPEKYPKLLPRWRPALSVLFRFVISGSWVLNSPPPLLMAFAGEVLGQCAVSSMFTTETPTIELPAL